MQLQVSGHVLQMNAYRKAPLKADPTGGGSDFRQDCGLLIPMGNRARNALDPASQQPERLRVEVDVDVRTFLQVADRLLLVQCDDAPIVVGRDANARLANPGVVTDPEPQIVNMSGNRREDVSCERL